MERTPASSFGPDQTLAAIREVQSIRDIERNAVLRDYPPISALIDRMAYSSAGAISDWIPGEPVSTNPYVRWAIRPWAAWLLPHGGQLRDTAGEVIRLVEVVKCDLCDYDWHANDPELMNSGNGYAVVPIGMPPGIALVVTCASCIDDLFDAYGVSIGVLQPLGWPRRWDE